MPTNRDKQDAPRGANASSSDGSRLVYIPRPDATPEGELAALALIYRFLVECAQCRKAAEAEDDGGGEA